MRFIFILLFLIVVSYSSAQDVVEKNSTHIIDFPAITAQTRAMLYEGDIEVIKQEVEKRKKHIERLIAELAEKEKVTIVQIGNLKKQLEKNESDEEIDNLVNQETNAALVKLKEKQESTVEIINNFKDIHYKHVNLVQELDKKAEALSSIKIELPYSIDTVNQLNHFIEKMNGQKQNLETIGMKSRQRLSSLSDILNDSIIAYTIALSDKTATLKTYKLLRDIYLYQADYAIIKLKSIKNQNQLTHAIEQISIQEKVFPTILDKILINEGSLITLEKNLDASDKNYQNLIKDHEKLKNNFEKIALKSELELGSLETKINSTTEADKINVLQLQKQIYLGKVQYAYFIQNLLQQKEHTLILKHENNEFQSEWYQAFGSKENKPEHFKNVIQTWQKKSTSLLDTKRDNVDLLESLNQSLLEISRTQYKFTDNKNKSKQFVKQQQLFEKQLEKNIKTIQRLSLQLTNNNELITEIYNENNRVLSVLSQQINKIELIGQWFGDKFNSQFTKVKSVLYYPLASFGDKPFTLATLLTILLYIILGFTFLRFFRKRLTIFLTKRTKLSEGASNSIATLLYYLGGFLVFMAALTAAGFNLGQMMIVFGALGVGIGFGLQNIASNFISGMILLVDRTLTVGDSITLNDGAHGKVVKLAMRYTVIRTNGGYDIIVPNSELIANRVKSMTFDDNYLRIEIPFGVSYDSDPEQVREITLEVANSVKHTINRESQKSAVLFNGMGDSSLDFVLRVWVFIYDRYRPYAIKSDYYYKLFKAFKEAGIEVPYPQRDLHIRSIDGKILKSQIKIEPTKN